MRLKKLLFSAAVFCVGTNSFAQTYEMDAEDGNTITTCSGTFTDSNPSTTGNYADNEDYTVTFCSGSGDFLTFDFDVSGFFDPLGAGDTLYMYDGTSTAGDLIMKIDNTDDPAFSEFMLSTFSTCVTFHFVSDGAGNNDGWAANISCPAPPASCNDNQIAADIALQAPYICNLDGYCGNTSSYYHEDLPNNMIGTGGNCPSTQAFLGTVQNNSWVRFEATTTSVSLDFNVSGCADGIQVGILQFDGTNWVRFSDCATTDGGNNGSFTLVGSGLTIGETYYLMMDGNMGANCDYLINVTGGVGIAVVDAGVDQTICGGNVNLTATGPGSAVYTWHSLDGLVTGATGANQTFSPLVTTTYVVEVTGGGVCENQTDTVVVTVNTGSVDAGSNGSITFCNTDSPVDLINSLVGTPDAGGTWSPAMNSGTGVFTPGTDAAVTYTYTVTGGCGSASADVVVTVDNGTGDAGTNGLVAFCNSDAAADLINSLVGTPDAGGTWSPAMNSGTGVFTPGTDPAVTYTYSITNACGTASADVLVTVDNGTGDAGSNGAVTFCNTDSPVDLINSLVGTPDAGGTWSPAMNSGTGVFTPGTDPAVIYTYSLSNACGNVSANVVVTVDDGLANTGVDGSITLCVGDPATDLFNQLTGTPDAGGLWSPAMTSGTGVFDPGVDAANTYTYSISNACGTSSSEVSVSVVTSPDAGTNGTATFCENDASDDLFSYLTGLPDGGGTWTPSLNSGTGVFNPSQDSDGTYTYTIVTSCGTASAEVNVIVNSLPDVGINSNATFCPTDPTNDLITYLGGTPEAGGIWLPTLTSGTGDFDPSQDAVGIYTYTVTNSCGSSSSTIEVMITNEVNGGDNSSITICDSESPFSLLDSLSGSPDAGGTWSPILASGTEVFNPAIDAEGVYTYTVTNSCGTASAEVTVTYLASPNAGSGNTFVTCESGDAVDLLTIMNGSPESGGVWSPILISGSNSFDPNVDAFTEYTYTVINSCGSSSADLVITSDGADCDQHIYIPNVFSPDANGENDVLFVRGKGIDFFTFSVFNRWGQMIFQSSSLDVGWDGQYGGKPVNAGVFVYVLKGEFANGEEIDQKGNVTLVK